WRRTWTGTSSKSKRMCEWSRWRFPIFSRSAAMGRPRAGHKLETTRRVTRSVWPFFRARWRAREDNTVALPKPMVGAPITATGGVAAGPLDSDLPTDASSSLPSGIVALGLVGDEGVSLT